MLAPPPLATALQRALVDPSRLCLLDECVARDRRDAVASLLRIYALHLAPLDQNGEAAELQHHPALSSLKSRLEQLFIAPFEREGRPGPSAGTVVDAMRALAHSEAVPAVYDWIAERATLPEIAEFVAVEGGPDAGFDDLVALCQVGIAGVPKVALAKNYWDEMGGGDPARVHTHLHDRLVDALGVESRPVEDLPLEALERSALNGYVIVNRARQPEAIGALGLLECQAGPRCRKVVGGLRRVGAPAGAIPFYEEHAQADPRHGKDWLDHVVAPLVDRHPAWGPGILRGARWRARANRRLFQALQVRFLAAAA